MFDYIGYIIVFLFLLVSSSIYCSLLYIEKKRIYRYFERGKKEIKIIGELITIAEEVHKTTFEKLPNIHAYLKQAEIIVRVNGFSLKKVEISTLNKCSDNDKCFNKNAFFEEYLSAPREVCRLIHDCSDTLGLIYQLSHPVAYAYKEFKKKILLRILTIIVTKNHEAVKKKVEETARRQEMKGRFVQERFCT